MGSARTKKSSRLQRSNNDEGIDFVRCRICGDHRRVLSGRHLSKHGTDREEYMEEYTTIVAIEAMDNIESRAVRVDSEYRAEASRTPEDRCSVKQDTRLDAITRTT
jgi:hypothetical protein